MKKLQPNEETRHGDISFHFIKKIPDGAKKISWTKEFIVAKGEATGHSHKLIPVEGCPENSFNIYELNGQHFVEIIAPTIITHEEHELIEFTKGIYIIEQETEFNPFTEELNKIQD